MIRKKRGNKLEIGCPNSAQKLLLQAALEDGDHAGRAWHNWLKENDIQTRGLDFLDNDSRRLLPLVGYNLNRMARSTPEVEAIKHLSCLEWARTRFLFKAISEAVEVLQGAGIEVLLIKGIPLATEYYPAPGLRPMNDGDLMVRPADFEAVLKILADAGYQPTDGVLVSRAHHAMSLRNPASQEIDVHQFALGACPFAPQDDDFWQNAVPLSLNGVATCVTNATDTLFLCCANSLHSPVRWVADSLILLRHHEIDWPRFLHQAQSRSLQLVIYKALSYLEREFKTSLPDFVLENLACAPISQMEKREYRAWQNPHSYAGRTAIRYASYQRLQQARPDLSWLDYLQLLGELKSPREIPRWLLIRGWEMARFKR